MYAQSKLTSFTFSPQHYSKHPSSTKHKLNLVSDNYLYGATHRQRIILGFPVRRLQRPTVKCLKQDFALAVKDDLDMEMAEAHKVSNKIQGQINDIKKILSSIKGGQISISPYDTAWIALVEKNRHEESSKISSKTTPQFPECLEWIANNQLQDGSWGVTNVFSAYDRLINTLACIIALKKWNIHPQKIKRGITFMKENFGLLQKENSDHMTVGFEILFPTLIKMGRMLDIELPDDSDPIMQDINTKRDEKLARIPMDVLHKDHMTILFSLEGIMGGLDWEKVLKLLCEDGSMWFSPAATAYTLMHTKDAKCMRYITQTVNLFGGGVPNVYPVDMFARSYAVDRIQRLGISRYFHEEIEECINYLSRYWTDKGIFSTSNSPLADIDDSATGFRNLRLHGHEISAEAFWDFKHGDAFCCFPRQSSESVTAMLNFYRASQLMFPGEIVLEEGKKFAYKFLRERQANRKLEDKWLISKGLPAEVGYALEVPWYANLPRVETRFYIEQYGGQDDKWIGKCLYEMPEVNNQTYLELAKSDFNNCQEQHQMEWEHIIEWYKHSKFEEFGFDKESLLLSYFLAAASIFEPKRSTERLAWAKVAILVQIVVAFFSVDEKSFLQRKSFMDAFISSKWSIGQNGNSSYRSDEGLLATLFETLNQLSAAAQQAHPVRDIFQYSQSLYHAWERWLVSWVTEGVSSQSEAELLVQTITICSGQKMSTKTFSDPQYKRLVQLLNEICLQLRHYHKHKVWHDGEENVDTDDNTTTIEIESNMKELVRLVLQKSSDGIDPLIKQTFLTVAKSFYYTSYFPPTIINVHIDRVLFQPVSLC